MDDLWLGKDYYLRLMIVVAASQGNAGDFELIAEDMAVFTALAPCMIEQPNQI